MPPAAPGARKTTRVLRALNHRFSIDSDSAEACRYLDELFAALAEGGAADVTYRVEQGPLGGPGWTLHVGEHSTTFGRGFRSLVDVLLWHVNKAAVASAGDAVVLHAAAAARSGGAILLPGPSGTGKSTVVTSLVRRGFAYLTDEAAAIPLGTQTVRAFPKPVCLEPGAQGHFPDLRPVPSLATDDEPGRWLVPAGRLRPGAAGEDSLVRSVVLMAYERGVATAVARLEVAEAALALGEHWFRPPSVSPVALQTLMDLARSVPCFRVRIGGLEAANLAIDTIAGAWDSGEEIGPDAVDQR